MFYREYGPPHFHASYGEYNIVVSILDGVVSGTFPRRARRLVLEWFEFHKAELEENWELAQQRKPLKHIAPIGVRIMIKVEEARHVNEYVIWLRFSDGTEGEVNLRDELYGEVFEPLKQPDVFKPFFVNPEWGTIAWPNGADFAPEFLYSSVAVHA